MRSANKKQQLHAFQIYFHFSQTSRFYRDPLVNRGSFSRADLNSMKAIRHFSAMSLKLVKRVTEIWARCKCQAKSICLLPCLVYQVTVNLNETFCGTEKLFPGNRYNVNASWFESLFQGFGFKWSMLREGGPRAFLEATPFTSRLMFILGDSTFPIHTLIILWFFLSSLSVSLLSSAAWLFTPLRSRPIHEFFISKMKCLRM